MAGLNRTRRLCDATGILRAHRHAASRKYDNSPMPYSIFFAGGYAIHGTYETAWLGRPASHGCVRLDPANAAILYQTVQAESASITISGTPPPSAPFYTRRSAELRPMPRHNSGSSILSGVDPPSDQERGTHSRRSISAGTSGASAGGIG